MNGQNGQTVAYIRVSSSDQNPARQFATVGAVDRTFEDRVSGKSRVDRPALTELLAYVREGDTVLVASMDRMARSLADLQAVVEHLVGKGASVRFVKEGLTFLPGADDPMARFQLQLIGAVAELERSLIRERHAEGVAVTKARGVYTGRAPKRIDDQVMVARDRIRSGVPKSAVARELRCRRQTLYAAQERTLSTGERA